jgi:death-on-curing protein
MPDFLEVDDVLTAHADQVERYGGVHGVRDVGLLESAVAQPRASFGGQLLHADLFHMAAAYLYHLVKNHPFVDGNKRAAATAALLFLDLNGLEIDAPAGSLYDVTIAAATDQADRAAIADFFQRHARSLDSAQGL